MGIKDIRMYDFDTVEPHNVPNQLFGYNDVGTSKIEAMMKILHNQIEWDENSDNSILTSQENTFKFVTPDYQEVCGKIEKITKENFSQLIENGYVFCLVDSMSARKDLFECCKYNIKIKAFFETRIGTDSLRVYRLNPSMWKQVEEYESTLYSDEESEESFCATPQTIVATSNTAASLAIWKFIETVNAKTESDVANEIILDVTNMGNLVSYWK
jgi:molybdopterin/thiamine biosynthesis adenylyltransferase